MIPPYRDTMPYDVGTVGHCTIQVRLERFVERNVPPNYPASQMVKLAVVEVFARAQYSTRREYPHNTETKTPGPGLDLIYLPTLSLSSGCCVWGDTLGSPPESLNTCPAFPQPTHKRGISTIQTLTVKVTPLQLTISFTTALPCPIIAPHDKLIIMRYHFSLSPLCHVTVGRWVLVRERSERASQGLSAGMEWVLGGVKDSISLSLSLFILFFYFFPLARSGVKD
ncbi:hypothetical protein HOY82DRAFT_2879 [Tuber indicum]|nr:hypothetical protein HOY82DRAFT_2879 [Tuber indicum]